jgi:hypothetical protein
MKRLSKHCLYQLHCRYPESENLLMRNSLWKVAVINPVGSVAANILTTEFHGDTNERIDERESNGEDLWVIIREGRCVTLFWRRSEQPIVAELLRVDRVICPEVDKGVSV